MAAGTIPLTKRAAWQALKAHHAKVAALSLRQLFADDQRRGERLAVDADPDRDLTVRQVGLGEPLGVITGSCHACGFGNRCGRYAKICGARRVRQDLQFRAQ